MSSQIFAQRNKPDSQQVLKPKNQNITWNEAQNRINVI